MKETIINDNDDTRRTRSQVAPDWTVTESLILVNEIAAVEADCSAALSSYQQWNIIASNCAALDVVRNMGQCRRKWDSLMSDYERIRAWDESKKKQSRCSYWLLKSERVKKLGLPESFDHELFKAIDGLVRAREERGMIELESDPEAGNEVLDVTVELGFKRKRQRSRSGRHGEERPKKSLPVESSGNLSKQQDQIGLQKSKECHEEEPEKDHLEEEYLKDFLEEIPKLKCRAERTPKGHLEMSVKSLANEEPHENCETEQPKPASLEKLTICSEENEETMTLKLQELAVKIQGIANESADYQSAGSQNTEDYHTEFARRQGDKLIENLGDFSDILKKLCDLLQDCK